MSKVFTVTVEYDVYAETEKEARDINFWCNELDDDGMVVAVDEVVKSEESE